MSGAVVGGELVAYAHVHDVSSAEDAELVGRLHGQRVHEDVARVLLSPQSIIRDLLVVALGHREACRWLV